MQPRGDDENRPTTQRVVLVYCAGGNRRFAEIAIRAGFAYGCRSDHHPYFPVDFADVNWKRLDWDRHLAFVREHRPQLAVAPDVEDMADLAGILRYAEQLARYAERVIIVPKVAGLIERLQREAWLVLGYSVPTRYGASHLPTWAFSGWPVHLLGGNPQRQLLLARYLSVVSADGNAHHLAARFGVWFDGQRWASHDRCVPLGPDLPYRAFALSCNNIASAWETLERDGEAMGGVR